MYPGLFRRVVATLIDLAVVFTGASFIAQGSLVPAVEGANFGLAVAFVLLYEPVLSSYACTLGQSVMRTRVRRVGSLERISLGKAYLRFFMKYVASVIGAAGSRGMVRVWPREDRRAIHDQTAETVVVNASALER